MEKKKRHTTFLRRMLRFWRPTAKIMVSALGIILLALLLVIGLPQSRRALLHKGLDMAGNYLPGQLAAERADWPGLGRMEIDNLVWAHGPDVLAQVKSVRLQVDLSDLLHRDLTVRHAAISGVTADIPLIQSQMVAFSLGDSSINEAKTNQPQNAPAFPRVGSLLSLPSVAVERLALLDIRAVTAPAQTVYLDSLTAHLDIRYQHTPQIDIMIQAQPMSDLGIVWRVKLAGSGDKLELDLATLHAANPELLPSPSALPMDGKLSFDPALLDSLTTGGVAWPALELHNFALAGDLGSWTINSQLNGRQPGQITLSSEMPVFPAALMQGLVKAGADTLAPGLLDTLASRWAANKTPGLDLEIGMIPPPVSKPPTYAQITVKGDMILPGPVAFEPLLPPQLLASDLGPVVVRLDARYSGTSGAPEFAGHIDLSATEWIDAGFLQARGSPKTASLDSLVLRLPGLEIFGSGSFGGQDAEMELRLALPDATLLQRWNDPALAGIEFNALASFSGSTGDSLRSVGGNLRLDVQTPQAGLKLDSYLEAHNLDAAPAIVLTGDTLLVTLDQYSLANREPWRATFSAADSTATISGLDLEGALGQLSLNASVQPDSVTAHLGLDLNLVLDSIRSLLPPDARELLPQGVLLVGGNLQAAGSPQAPWAVGDLRVSIAENAALSALAAKVKVSLGGSGTPPLGMELETIELDASQARMNLALSDGDTVLTNIAALFSLPTSSQNADSLDVRFDTDNMDLARLQSFLPGGISLAGTMNTDTRVSGVMSLSQTDPDLSLSGGLSLAGMRLGLPDGSWMAMDGSVELAGTTLEPVVRGGLNIKGGLLRIPEPPPVLLPTSGDALLWANAPSSVDSTTASTEPTSTSPSKPAILPDVEFAVNCPGGLWLRGQGLDVEMSGNLTLHLRGGLPAMEGELAAVQGTMKQLGHVFNLERGRIIFYSGEDELNPELDLALGVTVAQYHIQILLTGTANQPRLEFASSPELSDGDIIGTLLFGKPMDELDEGQAGLLADRASQIALSYGSVKLQESLARELGVDVLSIAPSSGDAETNSLIVGKYLSPQVLVRYEQLLNEDSAFFMHLDYKFFRDYKLHTQISQGEDSGVEVQWEKDW